MVDLDGEELALIILSLEFFAEEHKNLTATITARDVVTAAALFESEHQRVKAVALALRLLEEYGVSN